MGVFAAPFVRPETTRIDLGDGHWIDVKRELTVGEMRKVAAAAQGDLTLAGLHYIAAYLVDWSLLGLDGQPAALEPQSAKIAALEALSQDAYAAIDEAIGKHKKAVDAEKKASAPRGGKKSASN